MAINFDDMRATILELRDSLLGSAAGENHLQHALMGLRLERLIFITNDYGFSRDLLREIARYEREFRIDLSNSFFAICQMLHSGKLDVDLLKQVDPVLKQGFKNINPIYIYGDRFSTSYLPDLLRICGVNMTIAITRSLSKMFSDHFRNSVLIFVLTDEQENVLTKKYSGSNSSFGGALLGDVIFISVSGDLKPFFKKLVFTGELENFRGHRNLSNIIF